MKISRWIALVLLICFLSSCFGFDVPAPRYRDQLIKRKVTLILNSEPPGAKIYQEGSYEGKTPLSLNYDLEVTARWYSDQIKKEKYLDESGPRVDEEKSDKPVFLFITGNVELKWQDTKPFTVLLDGYVPQTKKYRLNAAEVGYNTEFSMLFVLEPVAGAKPAQQQQGQQQQTVIAVPGMGGAAKTFGTLSIMTSPAQAEIYIDGTFVATTPASSLQLEVGPHNLEIRKNGYKIWARAMQTLPNSPVKIEVELESHDAAETMKPNAEFKPLRQNTEKGLADAKEAVGRAGISQEAGSDSKGLYTLQNSIDFNVLDSVTIDPPTGRITLVGHADARYGGPPIPYLDHLAELLQNPSPEFSFDWTPESQSRVKELFNNFNSDEYVKGLTRQWAEIMDANGHPTGQGRWLLPLIGIKPTSKGDRLGDLGVEVREITQTQRRVYERLEIISVKPGSAAERAGLVPGDVIGNYANAAAFMHDNRLRGEGAELILQILHSGESAANMVTVTLGGMDGDPWAELDKFDIVQKMLWAAGNEKGAMLINSFAQVQRQVLSGSKAGFQTAFSILVAVAGFNDPYWQDMAEYEAGRMSQNQVLGRAYRAIFAAMEDAFTFGDRPLTNTFDAAMRSEFDSSSAFDRTIAVLNERIKPLLEQVMNTLLAKNEEIQIPPDVMLKSVGPQVEVTPDYRGVDPHSALAHLLWGVDNLGKSLINRPSLQLKIPRYQSAFAFERDHPDKIGPWHTTADYHLWYSIESLDFAQSKDGRTLQTRGAKIRFNIREKAPDDTDIPPILGGYEELLTSLYNDFANEFPVLHELREAAKLAGAARWLKSKKLDLQLPRMGRIFLSGPDKTTGFVYLTWSPREKPGRLSMALSVTGGVSLNLVKVPKDIVGIADDGSLPVVDMSKNPVWNSKILRMPDGAPIPQPIGWATTGAKDGHITAVSFIPPKEEDAPGPVLLEPDAVENGVVLWKANDLEGAKTLLTKNVQKDRQRYEDQLQKLMKETDHINVPSPVNTPSPVVGDHIEEGVILGLFNPESVARSYTGYISPFSGKALKEGAVFATTDSDDISEVLRGVLDNHFLGEYTLNTPYGKKLTEKLKGKHFDRLIAHSNGATISEALIRKGVITVDELNVVGGDRSLINQPGLQELIDSGKVKSVVVWVNPGDIIPKGSSCILPTPLKPTGSIPLAAAAENTARALTGQGKGGDIKVVYRTLAGEQYVGQMMRLDNFDAHSLKDYFYNIGTYFKSSNK